MWIDEIIVGSRQSIIQRSPYTISNPGPYACVGVGDIDVLESAGRVTLALGLLIVRPAHASEHNDTIRGVYYGRWKSRAQMATTRGTRTTGMRPPTSPHRRIHTREYVHSITLKNGLRTHLAVERRVAGS